MPHRRRIPVEEVARHPHFRRLAELDADGWVAVMTTTAELHDALRQIGYDERLHKAESEINITRPRFG